MPQLYVANTSRQDQRVYYRIEFDTPAMSEQSRGRAPLHHDIPAGRQVVLGNTDYPIDVVQCIVEQLERYGAMGHEDVGRTRKRAPLVYNTGKSVPFGAIKTMMDINAGIMAEEGRMRRARAAVIVNSLVEDTVARQLAQEQIDPEKAPMTGFAVELEQEDAIGPEGRLEEGFGGGRLDPRGPGAPPLAPPPSPMPAAKKRGWPKEKPRKAA